MISNEEQNAIIGTGIKYPVTFSSKNQNELLELQTGTAVINQSIYTIMSTRIGERYNNLEFGSRLPELLFDPNDGVTKSLAYYYTVTALQRWEARITIRGVDFVYSTQDSHFLGIWIRYIINETNVAGSYVFPFSTGGEPMALLNTNIG